MEQENSDVIEKKLASNFVEEAGIRCFENREFEDWLVAIHAVLLESGIDLDVKIIKELFDSSPEDANDEIFELAIKSYLIEKKLLQADQVEGEDWELLFSKNKEVGWVDQEAVNALHTDPDLRNRLSKTQQEVLDHSRT